MHRDELRYPLSAEAIAQRPGAHRSASRLLVSPADGTPCHRRVDELPELLGPDDVLVLNDSRVKPARLRAAKESGGAVELLVVDRRADGAWLALLKSSRSPREGARLSLPGGGSAEVLGRDGALFVLGSDDLSGTLLSDGRVPLPPYIDRDDDAEDRERYQALHARDEGTWGEASASAAAPTAGLHLTPELLTELTRRGVEVVRVTLGVSLATFRPVTAEQVEDHRMHEERIELSAETAACLNAARGRGGRVVAVGTTSLRTLEAAASPSGRVRPVAGRTGLFLLPGSPFRVVDCLLTNFHQPGSTLLALVQAFAGSERITTAYAEALEQGYRFLSYGDAMLLERAR
ncbi:MAG: tRNA preQ1(34) S-adenosylmethionine ribosyltransferase-isomerase QueA [Acidobacteriota bacterium]